MKYSIKEIWYYILHRFPALIVGKYIRHNLIKVHWGKSLNNFGDCLQPDILRYYGLTPYYVSSIDKSDIVMAGTILQDVPSDYAGYVVGTGGIEKPYDFYQAKILAVRGKITRSLLPSQYNSVQLGDTGLLMPFVFPEKVEVKYDLGVVLHFVDVNQGFVEEWKKRFEGKALFINVLDSPKSVIEKIKSCKCIVSSSLHGLIIADSFHIPNIRIVDRQTMPRGFYDEKFNDYYSSLSIKSECIEVAGNETIEELIHKSSVKPKENVDKLISSLNDIMLEISRAFKTK